MWKDISENKKAVLFFGVAPILITWFVCIPGFFYGVGPLNGDPVITTSGVAGFAILTAFITLMSLILIIPAMFLFLIWGMGISSWIELLSGSPNAGIEGIIMVLSIIAMPVYLYFIDKKG